MNEFTALQMIFAEFVGTFVLILIGTGTCAAVTLDKSPAKDSGWLFITFGWGFAVLSGYVSVSLFLYGLDVMCSASAFLDF